MEVETAVRNVPQRKSHQRLENIDFDFRDAHDLRNIRDWSLPDTIRRTLRQRFSTAGQVIVLIGEETKTHHRFVRWEIDTALGLEPPIIAVNLNNMRKMDSDLCPPILRDRYVVHISYQTKIIKFALDNFPRQYHRRYPSEKGALVYPVSLYRSLGLL